MVTVSSRIVDRVEQTYGKFVGSLSGLPSTKISRDVLDEDKIHDQVALFCKAFGLELSELRGKRFLEIGSGFGILLAVLRRDYGAESYGVEPASAGFESSYEISKAVLREYGVDDGIVYDAAGELLPFSDGHFDYVFSSTVLEHTADPYLVLEEGIRVLRRNGCLQFVFPNYGAFFEGHYAIPWIPYIGHFLARCWVRAWGRNPSFIDTLRFTNYFRAKNWVKRLDGWVLSFGEDVFVERMLYGNIKDWGGLGTIKIWVNFVRKLGIIRPITWLLAAIKSFDPIVLSIRKNSAVPSAPDNRKIYQVRWTDWTDMKTFGPSSRYLRLLIEDLLRYPGLVDKVGRVLDVGCGEGTATALLAKKLQRANIVGVDRSQTGITCAKIRYEYGNLEFICREKTEGFESNSFDLVTCFEVLEHVEDWRAMLRELERISSQYLMVSFPTGRMRPFESHVGHLRNFRVGQFERAAESIGLEQLLVFNAGFPFYSPIFRELCNVTDSGGTSLTTGKYSWLRRRVSDAIYFSFKHLSRRHRGDQFCGLFRKRPGGSSCGPTPTVT